MLINSLRKAKRVQNERSERKLMGEDGKLTQLSPLPPSPPPKKKKNSVRQGGVKKHQTIDAGLISLLCLHYMCTGHEPPPPTTRKQPIRTGLNHTCRGRKVMMNSTALCVCYMYISHVFEIPHETYTCTFPAHAESAHTGLPTEKTGREFLLNRPSAHTPNRLRD